MKVYSVTPRGYCKGVINAIRIAKDCAKKYSNQPIYILGMIVHNQNIVKALKVLNIKTIDEKGKSRLELLDYIDEGVVIISAHGASSDVFKKANQKGLTIIDATCVDVIKTHDLIKKALHDGYEILYIGKKNHPESEGTIAIDVNKVHLIENIKDLERFIQTDKKYLITNQTTMGLWDFYHISEYALQNIKHVKIAQEICAATKVRQEAIANLPEDIDLVFIVGDPHSNNTTRLAKIANKKANRDVYLIESVNDIDITTLKNKNYIAVSSGASTPTYLTNQVINYLKQVDIMNVETLKKPTIEKQKILD